MMGHAACIPLFRAKAGQERRDIIITHALQAFNSLVLPSLFAVCSYIHFPKWHLRSTEHTRKSLSVMQRLLSSPHLIHLHQNDRITCFAKHKGLSKSHRYFIFFVSMSTVRSEVVFVPCCFYSWWLLLKCLHFKTAQERSPVLPAMRKLWSGKCVIIILYFDVWTAILFIYLFYFTSPLKRLCLLILYIFSSGGGTVV